MRILIALILAAQAWGAAATATQSGNWHQAATWGGSFVSAVVPYAYPNAGDTISIPNTLTVTCETGQTCTAGLGTGTSNIRLASVTVTAPGTCTVAPALTVSGGTGTQAILTASLSGTSVVPTVVSHGWYTVAPTTVTPSGGTCTVQPTITIGAGDIGASVTAAIALNASGVLALASGSTLIQRGDIVYIGGAGNTADAITVGAGATWSSASPSGVRYRFGPTGSTGYRKVVISGTADSRVTVSGVSGSELVFGCGTGTNCGPMTVTYADFIYIGTAYDPAFELEDSASSTNTPWDVQRSRFYHCGTIIAKYGIGAAATFRHNYNTHLYSVAASDIILTAGSTAKTTGTRDIIGSYFGKLVAGNSLLATSLYNFRLRDSIFAGGLYQSLNSTSWADEWTRTIAISVPGVAVNGYCPYGHTDSYWVANADDNNPHYSQVAPSPWAEVAIPDNTGYYTGNIIEYTGKEIVGDCGDMIVWGKGAVGATRTYYQRNNIALPSGGGNGSGTLVTMLSDNSTQYLSIIEHNTTYVGTSSGGPADTNGCGRVALNEDTVGASSGSLVSLQSNAAWSEPPAYFAWIFDVAQFSGAVATGDFNLEWNIKASTNTCPTCTKGYALKPAGGYGANDLWNVNPRFADPYRVLGTFSTKYLGKTPTNGAWTSGQAYTTGQTVTHSAATYYAGTVMLYRRIGTAGAEDATTQPGVGANWRTHWEFATIQDLGTWHAATAAAGKTITDGAIGCVACSPAEAVIRWSRRGQTPQEPRVWQAAHDGRVRGFSVANSGQGYSGACTATITPQDAGDKGSGAAATCSFDGAGKVVLTLTAAGSNYRVLTPASVTIACGGCTPSTPASITVDVLPSSIGAVDVSASYPAMIGAII